MKFKREFVIFMSLVTALSVFSGCGGKKALEGLEVSESQGVVSQSPETEKAQPIKDTEAEEVSGASNQAQSKDEKKGNKAKPDIKAVNVDMCVNSKGEFKEKAGELLDLSEYDVYDDNDSVSYSIKYEKTVDYDFDYTVKFDDGSSFTLPVKYSDVSKAGWSSDTAADTQVSNSEETDVVFLNSKGREIVLSTSNLSAADEDTEKKCSLKDCLFYSLGMVFYENDLTKGSDGTFKETFTKGAAPGITLSGKITDKSTVSDVVSVLGKPSGLTFYEGSKRIWLEYNDDVEAWFSSLSFEFSSETGYMSKMDFEYSYADAKNK